MDIRDVLPRGLEGSSLEEPLERLHDIYRRIDEAQATWIAATPFRCPSGCGSCCEGFEPDILDVEALYLAAWLARNQPARFSAIQSGKAGFGEAGKGCPLADPAGEYHCTVYGGRPLICRLFAYSGDRGKDGCARFRLCSAMTHPGPRQMHERELLDAYGLLPPIMGDFAGEAGTLLPDRNGERSRLRDALAAAASKIRHLSDLSASSALSVLRGRFGEDGDGDNDNPGGGEPPVPRAG
jgi:Fe-S-cluster containining protein